MNNISGNSHFFPQNFSFGKRKTFNASFEFARSGVVCNIKHRFISVKYHIPDPIARMTSSVQRRFGKIPLAPIIVCEYLIPHGINIKRSIYDSPKTWKLQLFRYFLSTRKRAKPGQGDSDVRYSEFYPRHKL